jgi:hypothetical protein
MRRRPVQFGLLVLAVAVVMAVNAPVGWAAQAHVIGRARFSLTGGIKMSWVANNTCLATVGADIDGPNQASSYLTISLQDFSAPPGDLTVQVPRNGGSFSLRNSRALVAVQLLVNNRGWIAESSPPAYRKGSGVVSATRNAHSGTINVTLKPLALNLPGVRNASRDLHIVGAWRGCLQAG